MLLELLQSIAIAVGLAAALTTALALVLPFLRSANSFFLCMILPSVVLILTQVVSSNLYLSLGLIGALSIVRFRTPVKSQLNWYLFLLIGVGVATGVNPIYAISLTVAVIASVPVYAALSKLFQNILVFERRFNSSSRVEVTIRYKNSDLARVSLNPSNGRLFALINLIIRWSYLSLSRTSLLRFGSFQTTK